MHRDLIKRIFDLSFVIIALLGLLPFIFALCLLVRFRIGRPIFFSQKRPGTNGKPFILFKFRTMIESRDSQGNLLADVDRLTRFGHFLRSTSLDELPELFNVIRGDMSLVGPRPLLMQYLDRYTPEQARRHEIKPGITGWAQVNGRNALTWEEKFMLDVWYVDNRSFWLDLKIIFKTVAKVLKREGINEAGQATMGEFIGNAGHNNKTTK